MRRRGGILSKFRIGPRCALSVQVAGSRAEPFNGTFGMHNLLLETDLKKLEECGIQTEDANRTRARVLALAEARSVSSSSMPQGSSTNNSVFSRSTLTPEVARALAVNFPHGLEVAPLRQNLRQNFQNPDERFSFPFAAPVSIFQPQVRLALSHQRHSDLVNHTLGHGSALAREST